MRIFILLVITLLVSGCGSIGEHSKGCYYKYYQGTGKMVDAGYWVFIPWLDVPFSAVLDTVTLPIDAICIANNNRQRAINNEKSNQAKNE